MVNASQTAHEIRTQSGFICRSEVEARVRLRDLWAEIEEINKQLATYDASAPGYETWCKKAKAARYYKLRERAELKAWAYERYQERHARLAAAKQEATNG